MDILLALIILSLATARVSTLIVHDHITAGLRHRVWLHFPPENNYVDGRAYQDFDSDELPLDVRREPTFLGNLIACHRCVNVWVVVGIATAYHFAPIEVAIFAILAAAAQLANIAIEVTE